MLRRITVPLLVVFVLFVAVAQLTDSSPRFRAALSDALGRMAGRAPGAPSLAPAPAPVTPGEPGETAALAPAQAPSAAPSPTEAAPASAAAQAAPAAEPALPTPAPAPAEAPAPTPPANAAARSAVAFEAAPPESTGPPDVRPPDAPQGVTATAAGHRIALQWRPAHDDRAVVAYEILRDGALVERRREPGLVDTGLSTGQRYCYVVRALDAAGNASPASETACATPPDTTPPQPPAMADAQATGERAVRLTWSPAADDVAVIGYQVLREGRVVAAGADTSAVEGGLTPLSRVCYEVIALDGAGNRSEPSPAACATLPDLTPPTPPTVVMARPLSETAAALTWSGAADESGVVSYDLVRAGNVVSTSDSARANDEGLAAGRTFCWTVRARDPAGNVSRDSTQACATMPDRTPPAPPPGLVAAPSAASRVAFAWQPAQDNVGVERYEVLRDGKVVATTTATKLGGVEGGLTPSTEYCFAVVALDAAGNRSAAAGPACARTTEPGVPAGPTALQASPKSASAVVLRWDSSPDPGMVYAVYWDGNKRIGATPRTEYTVAGLRAGEKRCYRVAAVDGTGRESPSTIEACAVPELRR